MRAAPYTALVFSSQKFSLHFSVLVKETQRFSPVPARSGEALSHELQSFEAVQEEMHFRSSDPTSASLSAREGHRLFSARSCRMWRAATQPGRP